MVACGGCRDFCTVVQAERLGTEDVVWLGCQSCCVIMSVV